MLTQIRVVFPRKKGGCILYYNFADYVVCHECIFFLSVTNMMGNCLHIGREYVGSSLVLIVYGNVTPSLLLILSSPFVALTGPAQSVVWDSMVPSRKRTCVNRPKPSPVEKLTRDLHTILHEQQSSCLSGSSEEDLLLESEMPMGSVEIGHGTVLIRHPSAIARDEESEASSLSVDRKHYKTSEAYSHPMSIPLYNNARTVSFPSAKPGMEKSKSSSGQGMRVEHLRR